MGRGMGIAGFILSLLGVILFIIPFLGFILAISGLICSIMQLRRKKSGLAIAGLVLGIVGILLGFAIFGIIIVWEMVRNSMQYNINHLNSTIPG
jgi:hypothetical protein